MLAVMFQREITPEFLDGIYRETEGNPFFVEEVCRALIDQGKLYREGGRWERGVSVAELDIPQNLRVAVRRRVGRLPEPAQDVLRLASIVGREFEWEVLKEISDLGEDALIEALEGAERAQLIEEVRSPAGAGHPAAPRFAFVHALVQHALQESVTGLRRQRLHGRVAAALERLYPRQLDDLAPRLGQHFAQAGEWEKAAHYLLMAGDRAQSLFAYQEAIEAYQQALPILKERRDYQKAARTLMQLGLVQHTVFNFKESRRAYQEGFALWQQPLSELASALPPAPHALRMTWQDVLTLDPTRSIWITDTTIISHLFRGLVEQTPEMDIVPDMARAWEVLEDGRKYIFHLRSDVRWSDGIPVTAHDFEYACKRILDPQTASLLAAFMDAIRGARAFQPGGDAASHGVGARALDDFTFCVELEKPAAYFLRLVACLYPIPRHVVEKHGASWTEPANFVTNGPFLLEAWQPHERLALARNPSFQGRFPGNLQRVELRLESNPTEPAILARYEADVEDAITRALSPAVMDVARSHHAADYLTTPAAGLLFLCFDMTRPPFDDPRVRRAFVTATDRATYADMILRGLFSPALGGLVPPGVPGHSPDIGLRLDPEEARRLLAEAGYPGGRGFPATELGFSVSVADYHFKYLQAGWRDTLGVDVTLSPRPCLSLTR
jgi:hypothetical protein